MVKLVADRAGKEALGGKLVLFTVAVAVLRFNLVGAGYRALLALNRKTAFWARLFALDGNYNGIDKLEKALFDVDYHHAGIYAYLRSGKPRAVFRADGLFHIVQKIP